MTRMNSSVVTSCIGASDSTGALPRSNCENVSDGVMRNKVCRRNAATQVSFESRQSEHADINQQQARNSCKLIPIQRRQRMAGGFRNGRNQQIALADERSFDF